MLLIIFILAVMLGVSDNNNSRKSRHRRRGPIGGFRKPTITYMMRG